MGPNGKAWPLDDEEVKRLRLEDVVVNFDMEVGDNITVVSGPFEGLVGVIKSIDKPHQKAQIMLSMFGRDTAVDMDFVQFEKLNNATVVTEEE